MGRADVLVVYISEAHAVDEWPMGDGVGPSKYVAIPQARSAAERAEAARVLIGQLNLKIPVVLDNDQNQTLDVYACWPTRFYIIQQGLIRYKAQPKECRYSVPDLRLALLNILGPNHSDDVDDDDDDNDDEYDINCQNNSLRRRRECRNHQ